MAAAHLARPQVETDWGFMWIVVWLSLIRKGRAADCSRERGYSRCRRLRTVLDLAPACLARLAGAFLCGTNSLRGPSSLCVQGCPVAQLRCLWCTGPGGFFDPRRGHFSTVGLRESAIPSNGGSASTCDRFSSYGSFATPKIKPRRLGATGTIRQRRRNSVVEVMLVNAVSFLFRMACASISAGVPNRGKDALAAQGWRTNR